mmetsp:Transcript_3790/g.11233  ORF Transcript_3790/g.11233 Transcript_3790/m.11233 type:complete len:1101 (+) Transcript_3790:46-3348(+)
MRLLVVIAAAAAIPQPQKLRPLRLGGGGDAPKEIDAITLPDGNATSVAHTWSPAEALSKMHARLEEGLTGAEAARRRTLFGPNALVAPPRKGRWAMLLDQFDDRLVQILVAVAVVSGVLGVVDADEPTAWVDPLVIVLILASNAAVGVWQESSAEGALDALRKLQPEKCCVRRAGAWDGDVDAADLAPGDVVYLRVGDKVPADVRLLQLRTSAFAVDEAALTGESETIQKSVGALDDGDAPLAARVNLCFAGTVVTAGHAVGVVVATGMATQIGRIQAGVTAAAEDREKTPLAKKLDEFGKQLTTIIGGVCVATFCASIPRFNSPVFGGSWARGATHYAKGAVALGVAAIPEGLPAVITLCLSLGTRRMAARRVVVRRLPSVETLGCTSVICSDKTGTLTTNQMTATALLLPAAEGFRELAVSGLSYDPQDGAVEGSADWCNEDRAAHEAAAVCSLCNDAQLARDSETGQFARVGEPTEAALRVLAEKLGAPAAHVDREIAAAGPWHRASLAWAAGFARVATLEFDRGRKSMSTLCRSDGAAKLYVKGAPDSVIRRCVSVLRPDGSVIPLTAAARADLLARVTAMASRPLRCLALATRADLPGPAAEYRGGDADFLDGAANHEALESSLTLCGVVGIRDPPRPEAKEAMRKCKAAGVRVFMITGDSRETAAAIGGELGILEDAARTWEGNDFFSDRLDDAQRAALLHPDRGNGVFCRTAPADKQRIIKLLAEAHGDVTAMTGDGVNDAPALKKAQIGIAVEGSTDAARAAADIVLTEPGLGVVIDAILTARCIFARVRNYVIYRIACTLQLVGFFFLASLIFTPSDYYCYDDDHPHKIQGSVFPSCDFDTLYPDDCHDSTKSDCDYPYDYSAAKYAFALPVLGIVVITILNDGCMLTIARDHVVPAATPQSWNLPELRVVAASMALTPLASSLFMLWLGLTCADGLYPKWAVLFGRKVPSEFQNDDDSRYYLKYEELLMLMYLKISISDFLTLFSARTRGPFYERAPAVPLFCAFVVATGTASLISTLGSLDDDRFPMYAISREACAFVWGFNLVFFVIQDVIKVGCYGVFDRYGEQIRAVIGGEGPGTPPDDPDMVVKA